MGIYYSDKVHGVRIRSFETNEVLYVKKYNREMTTEQKDEFVEIYNGLKNDQISIYIYLECTTTYDIPPRTDWTWKHANLLEIRKLGFNVDIPPDIIV